MFRGWVNYGNLSNRRIPFVYVPEEHPDYIKIKTISTDGYVLGRLFNTRN